MADMNKRPNTQRNALEDELTEQVTEHQAEVETGKYRNKQDPFSQAQEAQYNFFNVQMGHRRRHPLRVLQQHQAITSTTENAQSVWEQALLQDENRTKLPEVYHNEGYRSMASQIGLDDIANKAFQRKTNKMNQLTTLINA